MLTGLPRRDVRKQRERLAETDPGLTGYVTKGSLLLTAWHLDAEFLDGRGKPRPLPMEGETRSFASLLKRCGAGDVRPITLPKELVSAGAALAFGTTSTVFVSADFARGISFAGSTGNGSGCVAGVFWTTGVLGACFPASGGIAGAFAGEAGSSSSAGKGAASALACGGGDPWGLALELSAGGVGELRLGPADGVGDGLPLGGGPKSGPFPGAKSWGPAESLLPLF